VTCRTALREPDLQVIGALLLMSSMSKTKGFTLLELIITLAIVAIVVSVGVPSFRGIIMDNRLVSQTNQFVRSISLTRSAAVRYQRNAVLCVSANYDAVIPTCSASTDWSNGWIVWVDKNRDSVTDVNEVVSVFAPLADSTTFTSSTVSQFSFSARGFLVAGDDLSLCDNRSGETGRLIRVNPTGRTHVSVQGCT